METEDPRSVHNNAQPPSTEQTSTRVSASSASIDINTATMHPDRSCDSVPSFSSQPQASIFTTEFSRTHKFESLSTKLRALSIAPTRADLEADELAQTSQSDLGSQLGDATFQPTNSISETFEFDTIRPSEASAEIAHRPADHQIPPTPQPIVLHTSLDEKDGEPLSPRSAEIVATRRRHENKEALQRFIKIVEGNSGKPVNSTANMIQIERKSPGKLMVDQSLPVPKLFEVKKKVFSIKDNGDIGIPPEDVFRNQCIFEILETEQAYVESLDTVIDICIKPLRACLEGDAAIVDEEDIQIIFSNIETLRGVNAVFLKKVEDRLGIWHNTQFLGDIFVEMAPFFKTYCTYVDNYPRAMGRARTLLEQNALFANFLHQFQQNPRAKRLDLFSFLIKPIQRIPRYVLLTEAVVKCTRVTHPDFPNLEKSIVLFKSVADYVNIKAAESENRAQVWEIQNRFMRIGSQNIVEPARRFLREGILYKLSLTDNSLQKRVAYLFSDILLTAMPIGALQKQDKLLPLLTAAVIDRDTRGPYPHMFWFVSPIKTIQFVCSTKEDKIMWLDDINQAIMQLMAKNPHLAGERTKYEILTDEDGTPYMANASTSSTSSNEPGNQRNRSKPLVKFKNLVANTVEGLIDFVTRSTKPTAQLSLDSLTQPDPGAVSPRGDSSSHLSQAGSPRSDIEDDGFMEIKDPKLAGVAADPQLLKNALLHKGLVQLEHEDIHECSGHIMWNEDQRHEKSYPIDSTYLVFPESYTNMFYRDIGTVTLQNLGDVPILLVAHQRKCDSDRMTYYKLQGHTTELFDYRGCWCIEVRQGNCAQLRAVEVTTSGGTGHFNNLNMM